MARKAARGGNTQSILTWRIWSALLIALLVIIGLLVSATSRHWLIAAAANVTIIGGIVAAPVVSLIGWVGVVLPAKTPLHQAAPALFIGAILWMVMAFISAHARHKNSETPQL